MTVLLAAKKGKKLALASDKQVTVTWHLTGEACKQFKKRGFIFAGTGTVRDIQIVMNKLNVPPINEDHNVDSYMFDIAESMRSLFLSYDKDKKEMGAEFIVISKDGMWNIGFDYSIVKSNDFLVHGCGCDVVLGAYLGLRNHEKDLEKCCRKAIEIVNENTIYCGKGVDVEIIDLE